MKTDFEIIDCHVHPAPTAEWSTCWYMPFESAERDVADLKACGITRACGGCIKRVDSPDWSLIEACNAATIEFQERFPDFHIPGVQVHPRYPDESCREMERHHREFGVRWVGELVGYMHGYKEEYTSKGAFQIWSLAQELGMVVNIHCRELAKVSKMCKAFPKLPVVLSHFHNDPEGYLPRLEAVATHPNLYFDISGTGVARWGALAHGVKRAGARKFLFGTDFPICTPASYVACVLYEHLSDEDRRAIFAENFKRLMKIA